MLVISSLGAGGAERVLSEMANYWQERGHVITLLTLDSAQSDFYALNPSIQRIALGLKKDSRHIWNAVGNNIQRILSLRRAIKRSEPHAIISFIDTVNVLTIVAGMGLGISVIVSERIDPRHHGIGALWQRLRYMVYPRAAAVVVQTRDVYEWMQNEMPRVNFATIPNPARISLPQKEGSYTFPAGQNVVAMGRLAPQKGFDLLIKAFAQCAQVFPTWNLVIFGEGNERGSLESLVANHALGHRIHLPGLIAEPMSVLAEAQIFVLSSRYEGFPNVLVEAMACGLPVITTDCPSGPSEIIRHGIDGILVPVEDVGALVDAMQDLMAHPEKRERLALHAKEVTDRFGEERVMGMWEALIKK